jgi:hypothetical protein
MLVRVALPLLFTNHFHTASRKYLLTGWKARERHREAFIQLGQLYCRSTDALGMD